MSGSCNTASANDRTKVSGVVARLVGATASAAAVAFYIPYGNLLMQVRSALAWAAVALSQAQR